MCNMGIQPHKPAIRSPRRQTGHQLLYIELVGDVAGLGSRMTLEDAIIQEETAIL
jgi:hypothetical protein